MIFKHNYSTIKKDYGTKGSVIVTQSPVQLIAGRAFSFEGRYMRRSIRVRIYLAMIIVAAMAGLSLGITVAFADGNMACPPIDEHTEKLFQYVLGLTVTFSLTLTTWFIYTNHENNKVQWKKIDNQGQRIASLEGTNDLLKLLLEAKGL